MCKSRSPIKTGNGDSSAGRGGAAPGGDSRTIWQVSDPTTVRAIDSSNYGEMDAHDDVLSNECTDSHAQARRSEPGRSTNTQGPPTHNRTHHNATHHNATRRAANHHNKPNTPHHTTDTTSLRPDMCSEPVRLPC